MDIYTFLHQLSPVESLQTLESSYDQHIKTLSYHTSIENLRLAI